MSTLKVEGFCPLGKECESVGAGADGKPVIKRCNWLVAIRGKHPQSEEEVDEHRCALAWMPILMVENAQTNRGQTAALESFRNEMVQRQDAFLSLASEAAQRKLGHD